MIKCQKLLLVLSLLFFFVAQRLCAEGSSKNSPRSVQKELIISYDLDEEDVLFFVVSAGFFLVCTSLLLVASRSSKLFYLALALELIMGGAFAGSLWFYKRIQDDTPLTILNEQGIWIESYGTIVWEDIEKVATVQTPFGSQEVIGITIKETSLPSVKEKASQDGRRVMFYDADSYGYHIFFSAMSVPFERILSFAERFM